MFSPLFFTTDLTRQGLCEQTGERFAELGSGSACKSILILVLCLNLGGDSSTEADLQHRDGSEAQGKQRTGRGDTVTGVALTWEADTALTQGRSSSGGCGRDCSSVLCSLSQPGCPDSKFLLPAGLCPPESHSSSPSSPQQFCKDWQHHQPCRQQVRGDSVPLGDSRAKQGAPCTGRGWGALTLMLPFETTKTEQTGRQTGILQRSSARAQGAELGTALSTPQCWESTALPHTHPQAPRAPPVQPVLEVTPSPL